MSFTIDVPKRIENFYIFASSMGKGSNKRFGVRTINLVSHYEVMVNNTVIYIGDDVAEAIRVFNNAP